MPVEKPDIRHHLAAYRTVLANERTLLAYTRTALTFFIAGVTFVKFFGGAAMAALGYLFISLGFYVEYRGFVNFRKMRELMEERKKTGNMSAD